jgi:hypothetical protein
LRFLESLDGCRVKIKGEAMNNFYIRGYRGVEDPSFHIGKLEIIAGQKKDKKNFVWAMSPEGFLKNEKLEAPPCPSCNRGYTDKEKPIEDDNGAKYTMPEFVLLVSECDTQDREKVGSEFS